LHDFFFLCFEFCFLRLLAFNRCSLRLLDWCGLNIVKRSIKVQVDISLDHTNLVVWFALYDVDGVISAGMMNADRISFEDTRVVGQLSLKNSFRIWQINKRSLMWLKLHESTLLQINVTENDF